MIKVQNLVKFYDRFQALKGVSFSVEKGSIMGFLGPNGAGKTTCMKILTGYMPPSAGSATVEGMDVEADSLKVRTLMGYLPESTPLYPDMIVYDFLGYVAQMRDIPQELRHKKILNVVKTCHLRQFVSKDIGQLSKGQRQRVGLAQAMIHDPQYLVLDEPTSGLDPNQIIEIRELIKELGQKRTIILSTHNLPEVQASCDRVLIIHEGNLVAIGSTEELTGGSQKIPRVQIKLASGNGAVSKQDLRNRLNGHGAVTKVVDEADEADDVFSFQVEGRQGEGDLRHALFRFAVDNNLVLLEMKKKETNLEGVFQQLTRK